MDADLINFAKQGAPEAPRKGHPARFVWVRNCLAPGGLSAQLIHEDVAISHLEIVAQHRIDTAISGACSIDFLARLYPAPELTDAA